MRKIQIENRTYKYMIGRQNVRIKCPNGKTVVADFSKITGLNWTDIERGMWKRYFSIKPYQVRSYISRHIEGVVAT